jgi:hypothetical protein
LLEIPQINPTSDDNAITVHAVLKASLVVNATRIVTTNTAVINL